MSGTRPAVYWDSCVFLSWLLKDLDDGGSAAELRSMVEMVESGRATLMTSAISHAEVVAAPASVPPAAKDFQKRFLELMARSNVNTINVNVRVAQKARQLRHHYMLHPKRHRGRILKLGTPDAIHLATAILYKADEFQTYDKNDTRGTMGLLGLNGDVAGENLRICLPHGDPQADFFG